MDPSGLAPSTLHFRAAVALLVVGLALTAWHVVAWPQFPSPEPLAIVVPSPTPTALPPLQELPTGAGAPEPNATASAQPAAPGAAASPSPAATSAPAATPTRAPGAARRYVVAAGDTLLGIALEHGTTVETILAANNLTVDTILRIGQELVIP